MEAIDLRGEDVYVCRGHAASLRRIGIGSLFRTPRFTLAARSASHAAHGHVNEPSHTIGSRLIAPAGVSVVRTRSVTADSGLSASFASAAVSCSWWSQLTV